MLLGELAGETAWIENPERSASVIRRILALLDTGDVDRVYGEAPRLDLGLCGDEARAALLTKLLRPVSIADDSQVALEPHTGSDRAVW
jgi:hypothetical protein